MTENLQEIVKWVESNPLIVTLTSGGAIVWLFANLKTIFSSIVRGIEACISFTVTNTYEDARGYGVGYNIKLKQMMFNNILANTKALWERTVNIDLSNKTDIANLGNNIDSTSIYESEVIYDEFSRENEMTMEVKMTNTYGFSIRLIFGKICFVNRSYKLDGQRITMNTDIRVFFASKKKFMKKLEDAINRKIIENIQANDSYVHIINGDTFAGQKMKRNLDSIFTENDIHKDLYRSIVDFINNKDVYKKLNYPYNYCGLLYGVPGSGKTSTILAIASELKRNIHYINLSQSNAQQLLKAFNDNPNGTIYVFEDIDAISYKGANTRDKGKNDENDDNDSNLAKVFGISLSDLLNITDGLLASDGTICLFTTNHIEKLDPAFLRAGRMNKTVEFKYMSSNVAKRMLDAYLDVSSNVEMKDNIHPAELQECILDVLLKKSTIDELKSKFCTI